MTRGVSAAVCAGIGVAAALAAWELIRYGAPSRSGPPHVVPVPRGEEAVPAVATSAGLQAAAEGATEGAPRDPAAAALVAPPVSATPTWKDAARAGNWKEALRLLREAGAAVSDPADSGERALRRRLADLLAYATARHAPPEDAVPHLAAWLVGVIHDLEAPAETESERTALAGLDPGQQTSVWTAQGAGGVDTLFYRLMSASHELEWTGRPWGVDGHPTDRLERAIREGTRTLPAGSALRVLGEGTIEFLEIGRAFYPAIDSTTERIVKRILPRVRAFGERYATSDDPHLREMARWLTARHARWLEPPTADARAEEGPR